MSNRREFIVQCSFAVGTLAAGPAFAQVAMLDEKDAQAAALAYKADGTKTDKVKFPNLSSI